MPSLKRKVIESGGPLGKISKRDAQIDVTAGMLRAGLVDDMIDSDGSDALNESDDGAESMDASDESDQEEGMEAAASDELAGAADLPKVKGRKSLYAPPTAEEMTMLKSVEGRGSSFAFGMKLDTLLSHSYIQSDPVPPNPALTTVLSLLHAHITSLPSLAPLPIRLAAQRLHPVVMPFAEPSPLNQGQDPKWKLSWEKPTEIFVAGLWPVFGSYKKGQSKGKEKEMELSTIDLAMIMPSVLFSPKDRTANRYFHKRTHYLSVVASSLRHGLSGWDGDLGIEWDRDATGTCILKVNFGKKKEQGLRYPQTIRILAGVEPDTFALSSLYPSKSNLRSSDGVEDQMRMPTPLYNHRLLSTLTARRSLLHLHRIAKSCPAFRDALALWRVWGYRRGLDRMACGGAESWEELGAAVLSWVVEGGVVITRGKDESVRKVSKGLGRGLKEWQLIKGGWEFLASTDFEKTAMFSNNLDDTNTIPAFEFIKGYDHVFTDTTSTVNLFAQWQKGEIDLLRHESRATLDILAAATKERDGFESVFMRDESGGCGRYDEMINVSILNAAISGGETIHQVLERPDFYRRIALRVEEVVQQGLGTRSRLVVIRSTPMSTTSWELSCPAPSNMDTMLEVDLLLDKTELGRVLDQGPPADHKELAGAFREFWGERAELRRFKDGSITESVVWDASRPEDLALIPGRIVSWVLKRHLGINEGAINWRTPEYLPLLQTPMDAARLIYQENSEKRGFRPAMEAFDALHKVLKASDDQLPLSILNFTPCSEFLRYTSPFVPHPVDLARASAAPDCVRYIPAIEVIVQFESSRRWPDDLVAMQKIKLAFLENLARLIQDRTENSRTRILLNLGAPDIQDHAVLEVLSPAGFAFHMRVYHDRERTLLLRMVEDPDLSSEQLRKIAFESYHLHVRRFSTKPRHHAAIATLHHLFPSYATATRLLKRWLASHMLSEHISTEITELIMADSYLENGGLGVPSSSLNAFHRALQRLSTWNWREEPLMVPIYTVTAGGRDIEVDSSNTAFPAEMQRTALTLFNEKRKADPECVNAALVICTEEDLGGRAWETIPGRVIAGRLVALAAACVRQLDSSPLALFQTPLTDYDFLIDLKPEVNPRLAHGIVSLADKKANLWSKHMRNPAFESLPFDHTTLVDFNPPLAFFRDLCHLYGSNILFFFDPLGGSTIAGLWNPSTLPTRNFKPFLGFASRPVGKESNLVELDKSAILEEIRRLGDGLISKIHQMR